MGHYIVYKRDLDSFANKHKCLTCNLIYRQVDIDATGAKVNRNVPSIDQTRCSRINCVLLLLLRSFEDNPPPPLPKQPREKCQSRRVRLKRPHPVKFVYITNGNRFSLSVNRFNGTKTSRRLVGPLRTIKF